MVDIPELPQMMKQAMFYLQQGHFSEAHSLFQRVLETAPEEFDALHILGVLEHRNGELKRAEELIGKAIAINPDFADAHYNLAKVLRDQSLLEESIVSYQRALVLEPDMDVAHYNLGLIHAEREKWQEAVDSFQQALRINPNDADYLFNLAISLTQLDLLIPAIECYQKLVSLHPSRHIAFNNLGIALRKLGKLDEAITAYQRAIDILPEYADAHFNLGNACLDSGQTQQALLCYQKAIDSNPKMAEAYNNLGNVYHTLGQIETAQAAYEKAVELDPASASSRHMLNSLTGVASEAVPAHYVESVFDKAAGDFEDRLVQDLKYNSPLELHDELLKLRRELPRFDNALDLGCGTGLSGQAFRSLVNRLEGVDISSKMVALAEQKKIYDALNVGEILDYLKPSTTYYDLFIAADVLAYFGNLAPLFENVKKRSAKGAYFLFTIEDIENVDYLLRQTGRFSHSKNYIQTLAETHRFSIETCAPTTIRMENNQPITGLNLILRAQ
jgi:predicted TPR repeat methyltransferase